ILLDKVAELAAERIDGEFDRGAIAGCDRLRKQQREVLDLFEAEYDAVGIVRLAGFADRAQGGDEIATVLRREPEVVHAVEMIDHLFEAVVAAVVEIWRVEIRIQQGRRLIEAARADVVLQMIDEGARRYVAAGAAQVRIVRKRFC